MTARPAILAVDGGGTKVDAVLLSRAGRVVAAARWSVSTYEGMDGDPVRLDGVAAAIRTVCTLAGRDPDAPPVAGLGVYCLAGADFPADERRIARRLASGGWTATDVVRNDTFAVLRAGSDRGWGVAVVCGYGINCSAVAPDGRTFRFPALGELSGDWGGGRDIGSLALWYALRATDGRGARTSLVKLVPEQFGMRRPATVMEAMHYGRLPAERIAELAPVVGRAARAGDPIARGILDRQADEVVAMVGAALRKLRMTRLDPDVVLGGGVMRGADHEFVRLITQGVHKVAPAARVSVLPSPPVVGAALLGLDHLGAGPRAAAAVRRSLSSHRFASATGRGAARGRSRRTVARVEGAGAERGAPRGERRHESAGRRPSQGRE